MTSKRIEILKNILLDLHQGSSPESVQERFNQHFSGVSALEISMMEHELMSSGTGITFEDIMSLCNVHANLFKGAVADVAVADVDQEGHPVYVFKQENLALRSALLRVRRILSNLSDPENIAIWDQLVKGLRHQTKLLAQFDQHYTRKEELFFPIMERYGHDAPPKVMWGVDDDIRDLFRVFQTKLDTLANKADLLSVTTAFETFANEFEEMIFKEESILLMILLETFTQDDWLAIADKSDQYGYAIIKPTQKWQPERQSFVEADAQTSMIDKEQSGQDESGQITTLETEIGTFTISFAPKKNKEVGDRHTPQAFGNGYLSVEQANLILNHLPMEITFVNKDDIFQYYNDYVPTEEMIFKRNPSQIGRHVELCHPPRVLEKVKKVLTLLKTGKKDKVTMWFKSDKRDLFVHITYAAVRNAAGEFEGVLEYVQEIQDFRAIDTDFNRDV